MPPSGADPFVNTTAHPATGLDRLRKLSGLILNGEWARLRTEVRHWLASGAADAVTREDGDVITDGPTIANLLVAAAEAKVPVEVGFGNKIVVFRSHFLLEHEAENGDAEPTAAYLRKRNHVLLAELTPSDGNERVVNAEFLTVHFPVNNKFTEFQTHFLGMADRTDAKAFKLAFPTIAFRKAQRRGALRAQVTEAHGLSMMVTRAAGVGFEATVFDVSTGGVGFFIPSDVAQFSPPSEVEVNLSWPDGQELSLPGQLIREGNRKGKRYGQVRFNIRSYELTRKLGELVAFVQRKRLSGRR